MGVFPSGGKGGRLPKERKSARKAELLAEGFIPLAVELVHIDSIAAKMDLEANRSIVGVVLRLGV